MPFPIGAAIQAGLGLYQTIAGGIRAKKSEKALSKMQSPTYDLNPSITDYYQKALARYNPNAYQSAGYRQGQQNIGSNLAAGITASQDRRGGLANVSNLVAQSNRASLSNVANAENQQAQALGQLGSAAGMKAGDDRMAFNINKVQPFERKYNLLAAKASGGNKVMGAGLSNIFGAAQSYDQIKQADKYYNSLNGGGSATSYTGQGVEGISGTKPSLRTTLGNRFEFNTGNVSSLLQQKASRYLNDSTF